MAFSGSTVHGGESAAIPSIRIGAGSNQVGDSRGLALRGCREQICVQIGTDSRARGKGKREDESSEKSRHRDGLQSTPVGRIAFSGIL